MLLPLSQWQSVVSIGLNCKVIQDNDILKCREVDLFLEASNCLSVCPSVCLTISLFVCLSVCLSVFLSVCLSACLPVCLWLFNSFKDPVSSRSLVDARSHLIHVSTSTHRILFRRQHFRLPVRCHYPMWVECRCESRMRYFATSSLQDANSVLS